MLTQLMLESMKAKKGHEAFILLWCIFVLVVSFPITFWWAWWKSRCSKKMKNRESFTLVVKDFLFFNLDLFLSTKIIIELC
jgi:amino acid permease